MFKKMTSDSGKSFMTLKLAACCLLLMTLVTGASCTAEEEIKPEFSLDAGLDSEYIYKGRNVLDSGRLATLAFNVEYNGFSAGVWYGVGTAQSYQEVDLIAQYAHEIFGMDAYVGYTRLEFIEDDAFDNEIHAGIGRTFAPITLGVDYIYSAENDGSMLEPYIQGEFAFCGDRLSIEPYVRQGFDFGYTCSDYDPCDYLEVGIGTSYALAENFRLTAYIAYSWAERSIKHDGLGDFLRGGAGISVNF